MARLIQEKIKKPLAEQLLFGDLQGGGDTLYAESEVMHKRESKSRPNDGIVEVKTTGKNQAGTIVCTYDRTILIPKRGHAVEDAMDY